MVGSPSLLQARIAFQRPRSLTQGDLGGTPTEFRLERRQFGRIASELRTERLSQIGNIAGSWVASYSPIYTLSVNAHCWHLPLHRYVWPSAWGPTYRNSYAICIACSGLAIVLCFVFRMHLVAENKKFDEREEGQEQKGFRYLL